MEAERVNVPDPFLLKLMPDPARELAMEAVPVLVAAKEVAVIVPLPVIDPLPRETAALVTE